MSPTAAIEFAPNVCGKQNSNTNAYNTNQQKMKLNTRDNNNNDSNTKNDDDNSSVHAECVGIVYTSDTHCRHTHYTDTVPFGHTLIIPGDFASHGGEVKIYDSADHINYNGQRNNNKLSLEKEEGLCLEKFKSTMTNVKHKSSDFNTVIVMMSNNLSDAAIDTALIVARYYSQQFLVVLFDFMDFYFKFVMVSSECKSIQRIQNIKKIDSTLIKYDNCMGSAKYNFVSNVFCRICGTNIVTTILLVLGLLLL